MSVTRFYHSVTGEFSDMVLVTGNAATIARNTPADHVAYSGEVDHRTERLDIETGLLVPFAPPAPAANPYAEARVVVGAMIAIEARQARVIRECALGQPGAVERLQAMEDEIAALRATLVTE